MRGGSVREGEANVRFESWSISDGICEMPRPAGVPELPDTGGEGIGEPGPDFTGVVGAA